MQFKTLFEDGSTIVNSCRLEVEQKAWYGHYHTYEAMGRVWYSYRIIRIEEVKEFRITEVIQCKMVCQLLPIKQEKIM
jgi:hypothetical protein